MDAMTLRFRGTFTLAKPVFPQSLKNEDIDLGEGALCSVLGGEGEAQRLRVELPLIVDDDGYAILVELFKGHLPDGMTREDIEMSEVDSDGTVRRFPMTGLPLSARTIVVEAKAALRERAEWLANLYRWRIGLRMRVVIRHVEYDWSFTGIWASLPTYNVITGSADITLVPTIAVPSLSEVGESSMSLAHQLLSQAIFMEERPRCMVAVSAMDIGTKNFIAAHMPSTQRLLFDQQAPPLTWLLSSYVAQEIAISNEPRRGERFPSFLLSEVKWHVGRRNKLAHVGSHSSENAPSTVRTDIIDVAWDLLYLLDYYDGCTWAADHFSPKLRTELGL